MVEFLATWHAIYAPKPNSNPSRSPSHLGSLIQLSSPLNNITSLCCQLWDKSGHTVHTCSWRFDATSVPTHGQRHPQANYASSSSSASQDWHLDSGATHHIMTDVNTLSSHFDKYTGADQIQIGTGQGLPITLLPTMFPLIYILHQNLLFLNKFLLSLLSLKIFSLSKYLLKIIMSFLNLMAIILL